MRLEGGESMKVVVIGTGFVAQAYIRSLIWSGYYPFVMSRRWIDYYNAEQLSTSLKLYDPVLVINCAGYTGETIDDCERDSGQCIDANLRLSITVAEVCGKLGVKLIHISSGCIFEGNNSWAECDVPNNLSNCYTICKFSAELEVRSLCPESWIFRIRMPYNHIPHPRNWLCKLAKYERILPGLNSATFLDEFTGRSFDLVMNKEADPGVYHAAYRSPVDTLHVARMLFDAGLKSSPVVTYPVDEFLANHVPRSNATLDSSKFEKAYGTPFGDPYCAIRWCIDRLKAQPRRRIHEAS